MAIPADIKEYFLKWFNNDEILKIEEYLITPPSYTCIRTSHLHSSVESAVDELRAAVRGQCEEREWGELDVNADNALKDVLFVEMQKHDVEPAGKQIFVDSVCGQSIRRGADIFKAGILGMSPSVEEGDLVAIYADVAGKCRKGALKYDGKLMFMGNGRSLVSRRQIFNDPDINLSGVGVKMIEPIYRTLSEVHLPSLFHMQNYPSLLVGHVLNAKPSDTIIDMCASPGGKSTHVASLLGNQGRVISIDKSDSKVSRIKRLSDKLNLTNVEFKVMDSRKALEHYSENSIDRIILDPPCSGIGQRPTILWPRDMSLKNLRGMSNIQRQLISVAFKLLKPGGTLVYSTCTLNPAENEELVAWALQEFPGFGLLDARSRIDGDANEVGRAGIKVLGLSDTHARMLIRFDHNVVSTRSQVQVNDSIAFFLACFTKT